MILSVLGILGQFQEANTKKTLQGTRKPFFPTVHGKARRIIDSKRGQSPRRGYGCFQKIGGVSPQIIHFNRVFSYKPSILGYPYFWKHPYVPGICGDWVKTPASGSGRVNLLSLRGHFRWNLWMGTRKCHWSRSSCLCGLDPPMRQKYRGQKVLQAKKGGGGFRFLFVRQVPKEVRNCFFDGGGSFT